MQSCTGVCSSNCPDQHNTTTVVQPFMLVVEVPCALIRSEEKQQYTSHHLPLCCLGTSRKDSAQGSTSSSHLAEHWEQQTAQCTEFTSLWPHPTTGGKGHHRESCKACYPDLPDSFHMRTRRQTEPAVVWFKIPFFSPFFLPSLKETVLYTANAHLLGNAGEATGLQGFKQWQESSSGNPTEASQAAKATSSSESLQTKRAASLGKPKWHFNYDCLLSCPQAST